MISTTAPAPPELHWSLRLLRRVVYTLGIGTAVAVVLTLLFRSSFGFTLVYSWCISLGCSFAIDGLRRAASAWVYRNQWPRSAEAQAHWPGWGWMSVCLLLGTLIGFSLGAELGSWLTGTGGDRLFSGGRQMAVALLVISLLPGAAATYYFHAQGQLQTARSHAEAAQRQAAETRLKLLESQLEPHMLFNTLANLRALIALDPERAQAMLDRLIDFLRATLNGSRAPLHPLSAEFTRVADYLALMQVRMGERLRVELDLPEALANATVPPLLLQPLVENAIKHGLEPRRGSGLIRVEALRQGQELVLRVTDTGVGLAMFPPPSPTPGTGFGLAQIRERLATVYGPAASLTLEPGPAGTGGTVATLRWPEPASRP
ncbi:MAG TPA: histidine kinase [Ideonella sp.]|nr:histidine kinase [Ideonella sp.]